MAQRCRIDVAWYDENGYLQQDIRWGIAGLCLGIVMGQKGVMLATRQWNEGPYHILLYAARV